jgi:hypothetical protein
MKSKCGILVCETFRREAAAAVAAEGFDDVKVVTFPRDCGRPASRQDRFDQVLREAVCRFDHVLVLSGRCRKMAQPRAASTDYGNVTRIEHCFDLFLPSVTIRKYLADGAYLLTSGWLDTWAEREEIWGSNHPICREFLPESCSRLVLLNSGVSAHSPEQLASMAALVDRPTEIVPVKLEMLRLMLAQHLREWRRNPIRGMECPAGMQPAEYAVVFDKLSGLAECDSEERAIRAIFDLFDTIYAPSLMVYLPLREGSRGTPLMFPVGAPLSDLVLESLAGLRQNHMWSESGAGLLVRMQRNGETLGALLLEGTALLQHKEHYLNLTLTILPVLTLAVSNARILEQLKRSREPLRDSNGMVRHESVGTIAVALNGGVETRRCVSSKGHVTKSGV